MYPTVSDVLTLPVIRQGKPELVAGGAGVGRRVRWVHVAEIADIAHLLHGGELVLTTGIALPDDPVALTRYIDELAGVGMSKATQAVVPLHYQETRIFTQAALRTQLGEKRLCSRFSEGRLVALQQALEMSGGA